MSANFIVYDIDTEEPRMVVVDAQNPDDPNWLNVNDAPEKHALLPVPEEKYAQMTPEELIDYQQKYIPIHKEWLLTKADVKGTQAKAFAEFDAHLTVLTAEAVEL